MRKPAAAALMVSALTWSVLAHAQGGPVARLSIPSFDQLDRNGDNYLEPREMDRGPAARSFATVDRDGDGRISRREYLSAMGLQSEGPSTFDLLDANHDGLIDADEASRNPPLARQFELSDSNRDGFIDRSEFSAFEAVRGAARP